MVEVLSGDADKHTCPMKVNASEIQVGRGTEEVMQQQVYTFAFWQSAALSLALSAEGCGR